MPGAAVASIWTRSPCHLDVRSPSPDEPREGPELHARLLCGGRAWRRLGRWTPRWCGSWAGRWTRCRAGRRRGRGGRLEGRRRQRRVRGRAGRRTGGQHDQPSGSNREQAAPHEPRATRDDRQIQTRRHDVHSSKGNLTATEHETQSHGEARRPLRCGADSTRSAPSAFAVNHARRAARRARPMPAARSMATSMFTGCAFPVPAMSNAVP